MSAPHPHDNTVVVHLLENGEMDILSSAHCKVFVIDQRKGHDFEYELVINDPPEIIGGYIDDNTMNWPCFVVDPETREQVDMRQGMNNSTTATVSTALRAPAAPINDGTRLNKLVEGNVVTVNFGKN